MIPLSEIECSPLHYEDHEVILRAIELFKKQKKKKHEIKRLFCVKCKKEWPAGYQWNYCPFCSTKLEINVKVKQEKSSKEKILNYRFGEKGIERIVENLVKSGESFDEWYTKYVSLCNDASTNPNWRDATFRRDYQNGGITWNNYLVPHLLVAEDERIKGTVLWDVFQLLKTRLLSYKKA